MGNPYHGELCFDGMGVPPYGELPLVMMEWVGRMACPLWRIIPSFDVMGV